MNVWFVGGGGGEGGGGGWGLSLSITYTEMVCYHTAISYLGQKFMRCKSAQVCVHTTLSGNQTPDPMISSSMLYSLSHVLSNT